MLKELKNTVVHCKNHEEYDKLMQIYRDAGWQSRRGKVPGDRNYDYDDETPYVDICNKFRYGKYDSDTEISFPEFLREQGLDTLTPEDLKPGDWVEVVEGFEEIDQIFPVGTRYQVIRKHFSPKQVRVTLKGDIDGSYWPFDEDNLPKLRKCPPPEEKREEPTLLGMDMGKVIFDEDAFLYDGHRAGKSKQPFWKRVSSTPSPSSPMPRFKVGDKVMLRPEVPSDTCGMLYGNNFDYIQITKVDRDGDYHYEAIKDDAPVVSCFHCLEDKHLIPYSTSPQYPNFFMSVYNFIKNKARSADDKALLKAGLIDDCGKRTQEGTEALLETLFEASKADLAKLAQEMIDEEEKSKK